MTDACDTKLTPGTPLLLTLLINLDDSSREAGPASEEKELRWGSHHLEMRRISQQRSRLEPFHSRYVKTPFSSEGGWAAQAASEGLVRTELPTASLGPRACTRAGGRPVTTQTDSLCLSSFKTAFILLCLESMLTVKVLNIYKRERKATHHPCENIYPPLFFLTKFLRHDGWDHIVYIILHPVSNINIWPCYYSPSSLK